MEKPVEVIPDGFTSFVRDTRTDLIVIEEALSRGDFEAIKWRINTIHLEARELRDYIYRVQEANLRKSL